jgi:predicted Zn-dependent protease with MMP-like domain
MLTHADRGLFDQEFEQVLRALPPAARELLNTIAVAVEDYPADDVLDEMDADRDELFGLYTGVPAIERSFDQTGAPDDVIHIYRLALLLDATPRAGRIDRAHLREQIRKTLLHELGHYHGFDEDGLDRLGY